MRWIRLEQPIGTLGVLVNIVGKAGKQTPESARGPGLHLKQVVQWQRLAPLVFFESFLRHAADHVSLFGEACLPGVLVGEGGKNLGCDRVLFIWRERGDLFYCLLQ